MSEIAIIPSVDQINLEYRQFQEVAGEAIKYAIECGLITPIHAKIFENDPLTLLATILAKGGE